MNIFFTIDTNTAGGAERVVATLANKFTTFGHDVTIINSDSSSCFYPVCDDVEVRKMGLDKKKGNPLKRFLLKYRYLSRCFCEYKPDIVITMLFNMEFPTILAAFRNRIKVVPSVRNDPKSYPKSVRFIRRILYPFVSKVVLQSKAVALSGDFKILKNIVVLPNPIGVDVNARQEPVLWKNRTNYVINVARLTKAKNQEILIKAFEKIAGRFPKLELHIYGEGDQREILEKQISMSVYADRMFLEGVMENAIGINKDCRMFILSSDFEGFPNALLEAMSYGIPSISSDFDTGVARELITDGMNGWLFSKGDENLLASKMVEVMALGERNDDISSRAADIYMKFNAGAIARQWEKLCTSIIDKE